MQVNYTYQLLIRHYLIKNENFYMLYYFVYNIYVKKIYLSNLFNI